jgi:hypothetical protein
MRFFFLLLPLLCLVACAAERYPLGMDKAQWTTLSPDAQETARAQQEQLDAQARIQAEADRQAREAEEKIRREAEEQARLKTNRARLEQSVKMRLGIRDDEWAKLPLEKQLELIGTQDAIERKEREAVQQAQNTQTAHQTSNAQTAMLLNELERTRQEDRARERRQLYNDPIYGNVAQCTISGGRGKFRSGFKSKWAAFEPVFFSIAKNDNQNIAFKRSDKQSRTSSFWVRFSSNGQEIEFCPSAGTDKKYKKCRRHIVSTDILKSGYRSSFEIPSVIDAATIACNLGAGRGQPQEFILQQ